MCKQSYFIPSFFDLLFQQMVVCSYLCSTYGKQNHWICQCNLLIILVDFGTVITIFTCMMFPFV